MKLSFINEFIRFLILICSFCLLFISMNTFSVSESNHEDKNLKTFLQDINNENKFDETEKDKSGFIVQNIHMIGGLLSSSSSQLTEQATSYALGRLNGTINSEAQKWLSQFGTAKVNLSLDRKGKLDNSSIDLLLPLYDNKADWLFFSQLGYRNKDSRHTVNLGLGGRYFTSGWMYGLNTFFDHDVTGRNKRLGLGGEAWTDYLKFSANAYLRLSKWRKSLKEENWEERPANGFDLNGEFFLPAYPNLGGKLSYEQYFGDNVTLFNRDTKQKNPALAKVGLSYTPVPLITMGVDYRHSSGGHSEARFQASLNYRFGVPFSVQLSPDNVAPMRTLAGSRYDLVERNNNIVLDHRVQSPDIDVFPKETLYGNGKDTYTYRILVIDPNSGTPLPNHRLEKVIWGFENDRLPRKDLHFKDIRTTTDNEGYLTASLVSNVGVDDIIAKVNVTIDANKSYSIVAKTPVNFKAVSQAAGLKLISPDSHAIYVYTNETTDERGRKKPYNVFNNLMINLTKEASKPEDLPEHIAGDKERVTYESSTNLVKIDHAGNITFPAEHFSASKEATVIATVTDSDTGAKYAYEYTFNPQRYVFSPEVGYVELRNNFGNGKCETLGSNYSWSRKAISLTEKDIVGSTSTDSASLKNEYLGFPGFGVLPDDEKIKVAVDEKSSEFILYYYDKNTEKGEDKTDTNPNHFGRLLCKLVD